MRLMLELLHHRAHTVLPYFIGFCYVRTYICIYIYICIHLTLETVYPKLAVSSTLGSKLPKEVSTA